MIIFLISLSETTPPLFRLSRLKKQRELSFSEIHVRKKKKMYFCPNIV